MVEPILIWAMVVSVVIVILVIFLVRLQRKHQTDIQELTAKHEDAQTKTIALGRNTVRGELNEILGTFKLLNEYDQLMLVTGATSPSLDLVGVKADSVDFIEIKSLKTGLTKPERKIRDLIDSGKVRYVIMEGNLPKFFDITERK